MCSASHTTVYSMMRPAGEDPVLLSPRQVADRLGCSLSTVHKLLRSGDLESVKIGQLRRIPLDAVRVYIERLRAEGS